MSNKSKYLYSRSTRKSMSREIRKKRKSMDRLKWQYTFAQDHMRRGEIMLKRSELAKECFSLSCNIIAEK